MPLHMLLSLAILLHNAIGRVHYVAPDDSSSTNGNEATQSLQFYLKNASKYFSSDSHFYFKVGHHDLNIDLVIQNVTNVRLTGESLSIIRCTSHVSIIILNVTNFTMGNITFENCSTNCSDYLYTGFRPDFRPTTTSKFKLSSNASILLYYCISVKIDNITIIITEGNIAMLVVNMGKYSKLWNIYIIVQTNSPSINESLLTQTNGILLYFANDSYRNNPTNKASSTILFDNFHFTTYGSNSHSTYYAISSLLFQNSSRVFVVIQNTAFINLTNVTALYYYSEMCGFTVSNELTIRNSVVSNNIGNPSIKMFHVILNNIKCRYFEYRRLYYLQRNINIKFINCTFKNNLNMSSMVYISPASSQYVTCYLYLIASSFCNNRNIHFFIMKSDEVNIWQSSNNIWFINVKIISNVHNRGQNLISVINSRVWFYGPIEIINNKYYVNIWKFHLSICMFKYNIIVTNNMVRQIFTGAFGIIREIQH